jgi:hypothetical protein
MHRWNFQVRLSGRRQGSTRRGEDIHEWLGHYSFVHNRNRLAIGKVGPFPSEEAFLSQIPGDVYFEDMGSFLTQELAVNQPDLSVFFDLLILTQVV